MFKDIIENVLNIVSVWKAVNGQFKELMSPLI